MFLAEPRHPTPRKVNLIIRYFTPDITIKDYCLKGRGIVLPVIERCPFCGEFDCLIGHGWYKKKSFFLVANGITVPI